MWWWNKSPSPVFLYFSSIVMTQELMLILQDICWTGCSKDTEKKSLRTDICLVVKMWVWLFGPWLASCYCRLCAVAVMAQGTGTATPWGLGWVSASHFVCDSVLVSWVGIGWVNLQVGDACPRGFLSPWDSLICLVSKNMWFIIFFNFKKWSDSFLCNYIPTERWWRNSVL